MGSRTFLMPSLPALLSQQYYLWLSLIPLVTFQTSSLPPCLTELFKPEYVDLNYAELLTLTTDHIITVTEDEARSVEVQTQSQSNSRLWFRMRTGRITGSGFKSSCHTNPAQPTTSLIMAICHPELTKFRSVATSWGCEHEKIACEIKDSQ